MVNKGARALNTGRALQRAVGVQLSRGHLQRIGTRGNAYKPGKGERYHSAKWARVGEEIAGERVSRRYRKREREREREKEAWEARERLVAELASKLTGQALWLTCGNCDVEWRRADYTKLANAEVILSCPSCTSGGFWTLN